MKLVSIALLLFGTCSFAQTPEEQAEIQNYRQKIVEAVAQDPRLQAEINEQGDILVQSKPKTNPSPNPDDPKEVVKPSNYQGLFNLNIAIGGMPNGGKAYFKPFNAEIPGDAELSHGPTFRVGFGFRPPVESLNRLFVEWVALDFRDFKKTVVLDSHMEGRNSISTKRRFDGYGEAKGYKSFSAEWDVWLGEGKNSTETDFGASGSAFSVGAYTRESQMVESVDHYFNSYQDSSEQVGTYVYHEKGVQFRYRQMLPSLAKGTNSNPSGFVLVRVNSKKQTEIFIGANFAFGHFKRIKKDHQK